MWKQMSLSVSTQLLLTAWTMKNYINHCNWFKLLKIRSRNQNDFFIKLILSCSWHVYHERRKRLLHCNNNDKKQTILATVVIISSGTGTLSNKHIEHKNRPSSMNNVKRSNCQRVIFYNFVGQATLGIYHSKLALAPSFRIWSQKISERTVCGAMRKKHGPKPL